MADKKHILTYAGLKQYEDELQNLKVVRRKEVAQKIKEAREQGDLSENAEYDAAKDEQRDIEARIEQLEAMLKNIEVVDEDEVDTGVVGIGCKVIVYDYEYDEEIEYDIVGSSQADIMNNKISDESPVGMALKGAKVGEEVLVEADKGTCIGECGLLYDDIIYYVLIDNKTHAGNLYSYNLKSRESNKLGAARELQRLEVLVDGKIYGCGYTKTGNPEVFLYDLKGKKLKQICKNGYFGQIVGKYIAIQTISSSGKSGMTLYRKSDGQKIKTITSNCSYYEFIDNTFYYVEPIAEFKYKIKSYNIEKKKTITYGTIKANEFGAITSKYLYYSNGPMIGECKYYKYSFAKKKSIRITEEAFQY